MGLELSEAVNKEKKREGKRDWGKRPGPDSPLQIVGEKGLLGIFLCFARSVRVGLGISVGEVFHQKVVCGGSTLCAWLQEEIGLL